MAPTIRCVEPTASPSLTKGVYTYDFGDTLGMTPLVKMHTLGHDFIPEPIHAGGLRYHGMAPLVSHLKELGSGRGRGDRSGRVLRAGRSVHSQRGNHPCPGTEPRHRRGGPRSPQVQGNAERRR